MKKLNKESQKIALAIIEKGGRAFIVKRFGILKVIDSDIYYNEKRSGWEYVSESFNGEYY